MNATATGTKHRSISGAWPRKDEGPAFLRAREFRTGCLAVFLLLTATACSSQAPRPQNPDSRNDLCGSCRMPVSDPSLAAQIIAPNEEPRFFDDLRCLRDYLAGNPLPRGAVAYVADHRTRDWVPAARAVFASAPSVETPMASHWVAYADENSRRADSRAGESTLISPTEIFGAAGPPGS